MYKVYKILFESGRVYVGSTKAIETRMQAHKKRFLKEYNDMLLSYEILGSFDTEHECSVCENAFIAENYDNSYNLQIKSTYVAEEEKKLKNKAKSIANKLKILDNNTKESEELAVDIISEDIIKYWRVMELYDEAQLLLGSKVGIHIMIYLKQKVNTNDYRIQINQSWLAEDIGATREAVAKNIKKLIDNEYLIKEKRGKYFINPKMFWIAKMSDTKWQELKQDFEFKLNDINFKKMTKNSKLLQNA